MSRRFLEISILLGSLIVTSYAMAKIPVYKELSKPITVTAQQSEFIVQIAANPTTGYSWVLAGSYPSDLIKPIAHHYIAPNTKILGASGTDEWTFKVQKLAFTAPTSMILTLNYVRPWEMKAGKSTDMIVVTAK